MSFVPHRVSTSTASLIANASTYRPMGKILIIATIDKGSIIWVPQMKVVWVSWIIIDKRGLFSLLLYQMLTSLMLWDD